MSRPFSLIHPAPALAARIAARPAPAPARHGNEPAFSANLDAEMAEKSPRKPSRQPEEPECLTKCGTTGEAERPAPTTDPAAATQEPPSAIPCAECAPLPAPVTDGTDQAGPAELLTESAGEHTGQVRAGEPGPQLPPAAPLSTLPPPATGEMTAHSLQSTPETGSVVAAAGKPRPGEPRPGEPRPGEPAPSHALSGDHVRPDEAAAPEDPGAARPPGTDHAAPSPAPPPPAPTTAPAAQAMQAAPPLLAATPAPAPHATAPQPQTSAPVTLPEVPVAIATRLSGGDRQFEIRLSPDSLGKIEVKLDINADGSVRTHFIVERPETLQLLRNDTRKLEQAFSDAGLATDSSGPNLSLRSDGEGQRAQQQRQQDQQPARHAPPEEKATAPAPPPRWRPLAVTASALDLTL